MKLEIFAFHQNQLAILMGKHSWGDTDHLECLEFKVNCTCQVGLEAFLAKGLSCTFQGHIEVVLDRPFLEQSLELEVDHIPFQDFVVEIEFLLKGEACYLLSRIH